MQIFLRFSVFLLTQPQVIAGGKINTYNTLLIINCKSIKVNELQQLCFKSYSSVVVCSASYSEAGQQLTGHQHDTRLSSDASYTVHSLKHLNWVNFIHVICVSRLILLFNTWLLYFYNITFVYTVKRITSSWGK